MKVSGITFSGSKVWMTRTGYWDARKRQAHNFGANEAANKVRVNNANNRFLDAEDRVEAKTESN